MKKVWCFNFSKISTYYVPGCLRWVCVSRADLDKLLPYPGTKKTFTNYSRPVDTAVQTRITYRACKILRIETEEDCCQVPGILKPLSGISQTIRSQSIIRIRNSINVLTNVQRFSSKFQRRRRVAVAWRQKATSKETFLKILIRSDSFIYGVPHIFGQIGESRFNRFYSSKGRYLSSLRTSKEFSAIWCRSLFEQASAQFH